MKNITKITNISFEKSGVFDVLANLEDGVEFTNTTDTEVEVKFSPSGEWSNGPTSMMYSAAGLANYNYQNSLAFPKNTSFALLAVSQKLNTVVAEISQDTTLRLKGGETLIFKMNDAPGTYANNPGKISVAWTILPVLANSGELAIKLNSPSGVNFTNCFDKDVTFKFIPSGTWKPAEWAEVTAEGWRNFEYQKDMKYPQNTSFVLLAVDKQTNTVLAEVSGETTLVIKAGQTISFIVNDLECYYTDNTGNFQLNWSVQA